LCGIDLYRPTPKEIKKECKPEERIEHGSKRQIGSEKEEELCKDYLRGSTIVQISRNFMLKNQN
jgi:hypothetical protein